MMSDKEFAVFIMSHGRAKNMTTDKMLQKQNYTGDWFVIIDNEDEQREEYEKRVGKEKVIVFDKKAEADLTDTGDIDNNRRVGVFARNAIQRVAKEMGYRHHLQLDDDFNRIDIRAVKDGRLACFPCPSLDKLFALLVEFEKNTSITSLSMALSSDFLGGIKSDKYRKGLFRKTMGSFLMRADDVTPFVMRFNDDVTTSMINASRGKLFFTVSCLQVQTPETQKMKGGMTESYIDCGTYRKSFYSVMVLPSAATVGVQGIRHKRLHHHISWENCAPKILSERWKK